MVSDVEFVIANVAEVISWPEVKVMFGGADVLNSKPLGAFNTSVPEPMSLFMPSRIVIGPNTVHAGERALAALSAEMLVPFVAVVMVTVATARLLKSAENASTTSSTTERLTGGTKQ